MRSRNIALVVLVLLAGAYLAIERYERSRAGSSAAPAPAPVASPAPVDPASSPAIEVSPPSELAAPALSPPVDLDAADRDLDLFGRVVDAEGAPVAGAAIECIHHPGRRASVLDREGYAEAIVDAETRSASDGTFAIRLSRGALRELRVSHAEYSEACVPACQAGERVEVVLHPGARIELRAVDESGAPVPEVHVRLWNRAGEESSGERRFLTGEDGIADIRGLAPGSIVLELEHSTLGSPAWQEIELAAGEEVVHEVVMPEGRTITGRVIDRATGRPIAGALVGEGWRMKRPVRTDADGRYRIVGFTRIGNDDLAVEAAGYGRAKADVPEQDAGPIDFELLPGDIAVGRVVDLAGAPLEGVRVNTVASVHIGATQQIDLHSARTAADGAFRIDSLHPEMPHTLVLMSPGYGRTLLDFDRDRIGPDGVIDLGTIALPPAAAIEGDLVDGEGVPVARVPVFLSGHNADRRRLRPAAKPIGGFYGRSESRRTDDLGRFRFPDLAPGEYRIYARPPGQPEPSEKVELPEGAVEPLFVRLILAGGSGFRIEVVTSEGDPFPGAFVSARGGAATNIVRRETDDAGIAEFVGIPGPVSVSVHAPTGFVPADPLTIDPVDQTVQVVLERAAMITGVVLSPDGSLARMELAVTVRPPGGGESRTSSIHSRDDGSFEIRAPVGAIVDVACHGMRGWSPADSGPRKWMPRVGSLVGIAAPAEGLRLRLAEIPADRDMTVRVVGPADEPFAGILVIASPSGSMEKGTEATTDERGVARFEGLYGLGMRIDFDRPSTVPEEGKVWIVPDPEEVTPAGQEVTLRLRVGSVFVGTVVDPSGNVRDGVQIEIRTSGGMSIRFPTREGGFAALIPDGETVDVIVDMPLPGGRRLRGELIGIASGTREAQLVVREE